MQNVAFQSFKNVVICQLSSTSHADVQ